MGQTEEREVIIIIILSPQVGGQSRGSGLRTRAPRTDLDNLVVTVHINEGVGEASGRFFLGIPMSETVDQ